uniref:Uncharacterized protein n=1 Tax=Avena sativa TaxID=4498 RepID=A0ACD5UQ55_AVESA
MKSKASKKPADEDEAKSKKIRSSRSKRRRGHHSRSRSRSPSSSGSDSPPRKRSKKPSKKVVDKKSKKNKVGSTSRRRRRRSPSPSTSPSSSSSSVSKSRSHSRRSRHSSISASERSVSPLPRSHSKDTRKGKGRGRDRDKDRKTRRARWSRSYSSSPASSDSSQSRSRSKSESRKRRVGGTRDYATGDRIVQDYDNYLSSRTERRKSVEDVDRDDEAVAFAMKGIDDYENNVVVERRESSPSKDSGEMGEILSPNDANATDEILPVGGGSPEVEEDLELILRQKALANFRKFKEAAVMPGKTDSNGTGKGVLTESLENTSTKIAEVRSAVIPSQIQGISFGIGHSAGSPELEDSGNGTSPWNQEMSHGDRSPGILEASAPSQQQGRRLELIRPTSRDMSQDGRNGGSVMQRLGNNPASSATVKQRLGSSAGMTSVQSTCRIRSVVSIPVREGLDGSEFTKTPSACENPVPVESSSEVGDHPAEINHLEGTDGDDRETCEASARDSAVFSADKGKSKGGTEDKDGSQFEKRTFSRMHDGETVQVSYKVYIPTTSPRLARRKLQR